MLHPTQLGIGLIEHEGCDELPQPADIDQLADQKVRQLIPLETQRIDEMADWARTTSVEIANTAFA